MNMENSAPDTSSGQGTATPDATPASGQGNTPVAPDAASGQGTQTVNSNAQSGIDTSGLPPAAIAELDKRTGHFNQKVTELAQGRSELQRQVEEMRTQQEQRNQALAQALGFAQPEQSPDLISELIDNPNRLQEMIQQEAQKLVEPIQQNLNQRDTSEYMQTQLTQKSQIKEDLRAEGRFSDAFIDEVLNVTNLVDPNIFRDQDKLSNPLVSMEEKQRINARIEAETAQFVRNAGGIRTLVSARIGDQFLSNMDDIAGQLLRSERQRQMAMGRGNTMSRMSGGAGMEAGASQQGAVNYRTEYVSR